MQGHVGDFRNGKKIILCECQPNAAGAAVPTVQSIDDTEHFYDAVDGIRETKDVVKTRIGQVENKKVNPPMRLRLPALNNNCREKKQNSSKVLQKSTTFCKQSKTAVRGSKIDDGQFASSLLMDNLYKKISEMKIVSQKLRRQTCVEDAREFFRRISLLIKDVCAISEEMGHSESVLSAKMLNGIEERNTKEDMCGLIDDICLVLNNFKEKILQEGETILKQTEFENNL